MYYISRQDTTLREGHAASIRNQQFLAKKAAVRNRRLRPMLQVSRLRSSYELFSCPWLTRQRVLHRSESTPPKPRNSMNSKALTSVTLALQVMAVSASAQGCDMLLRDGVFNTFNKSGYSYGYDQWHQSWCNKVLSQSAGGSSTGLGVGVVLGDIPIGLSFSDAQDFQRMYQSDYCGGKDRTKVDLSQDNIVRKTADPSLIAGYTQCRAVENAGLITTFANDDANPRSFLISMRWVPPVPSDAQVNVVAFAPKTVACQGDLARGGTIKPNTTKTMLCTRSDDRAVTATVGSNAGVFYRTLADVTPPPTDAQRVLGALPRGTILPWANKVAIPKGWQVCDGSNGTPNLVRQYIVGTASADSVGRFTGSETHTHQIVGNADGFHLMAFNPPTSFIHNSNGTQSNSFQSHGHDMNFTSGSGSSRAPGVSLMFIMKL
jgi:hypothetical protein